MFSIASFSCSYKRKFEKSVDWNNCSYYDYFINTNKYSYEVRELKKESIIYILSFIAVLLAITGAISYTNQNENLENFYIVEIAEGDSLWSIADKFHTNANISKQDFVKWVQDKNELHSSIIKPGDLVFVPLEKGHQMKFEQIASE